MKLKITSAMLLFAAACIIQCSSNDADPLSVSKADGTDNGVEKTAEETAEEIIWNNLESMPLRDIAAADGTFTVSITIDPFTVSTGSHLELLNISSPDNGILWMLKIEMSPEGTAVTDNFSHKIMLRPDSADAESPHRIALVFSAAGTEFFDDDFFAGHISLPGSVMSGENTLCAGDDAAVASSGIRLFRGDIKKHPVTSSATGKLL